MTTGTDVAPWLRELGTDAETGDSDNPYSDLARSIRNENIIPFLNNTLRDDRFMQMFQEPSTREEPPPHLEEFIATQWASRIKYPFKDKSDLARVAQYRQVMRRSPLGAKRDYLEFLKAALMNWVMFGKEGQPGDPEAAARIEEQNLRESASERSFADLVTELGLPRYAPGEEDPLRLLARLPFPIYITTSHFDFLERALRLEEKRDCRTEVCPWSGESKVTDKEFLPDPDYNPTVQAPLVFHLFGLERFPETLVLSLDDHQRFLVNIFQREAQAKTSAPASSPAIPTYLWAKIYEQQVLLLGYRLHSSEFQTVFRGIIAGKRPPEDAESAERGRVDRGTVIQLKAEKQQDVDDPKGLESYLEQYFAQDVPFHLEWGTGVDQFVTELSREYNRQR